jgi:hypothetical protein
MVAVTEEGATTTGGLAARLHDEPLYVQFRVPEVKTSPAVGESGKFNAMVMPVLQSMKDEQKCLRMLMR